MPFHPDRAVLAGCLFLAGCGSASPDRALHVVTGFASQQLCGAAFVSGLDPEDYYRDGVAPAVWPAGWAVSHTVDRARGEVRASVLGLAESRSVYEGPLGCRVIHEPSEETASAPSVEAETVSFLPEIAGPAVVAPSNPALAAALERVFSTTDDGSVPRTTAIVVVHDGRVVAERYAPGYGIDTPVLGWSASKSVVNALIGILVRQGRLSVEASAPVAAWSASGDARRSITIDHLLRMTSGLDYGESLFAGPQSAFDPSVQMLYDEADMAASVEAAPLAAKPGTVFHYSNGNTMILSRIIRDLAGGSAAAVRDFAGRELFGPLGMRHVTMEFDATGTPVGSSSFRASPRDWARFGLLYLGNGVMGGRRILPEGWVDYQGNRI